MISRARPWIPALGAVLMLCAACGPAGKGEASPRSSAVLPAAPAADLPSPRPFDPDELAALDAWRARRDERLAAPDGYLALVALAWLQTGDQVVGAGPDADVPLPPELLPPGVTRVGVLSVSGPPDAREVRFRAEPGAGVRADGQPLDAGAGAAEPLRLSWAGETTELSVGAVSFWVIERVGQLGVRARSPRSPLRAAFRGNAVHPASGAWRLPARFVAHAEARPYAIPNIPGSAFDDSSPGVLEFVHDGATHRLHPTGDPATGLSLIFGDASNGSTTYGGGRFLTVPPPDEHGLTWLDFNRAYNPPCAYSPYTTCPLPPPTTACPSR